MPVRIKPEPQDSSVLTAAAPTLSTISQENGTSSSSQACSTLPPSSISRAASNSSAQTTVTNTAVMPAEAAAPSKVGASKEKAQMSLEDAIDCDSVRGVFGWTTLDGVNVPYIIRKYRKFVAVRIVEKKMLSKYPNSFPDELGKKEPLVSYFVTEAEANLLNEINTVHCSFEYGHQPFTTKDLIVDLVEFEEFYNLVKKTFPEDVLASMTGDGDEAGVDEKKRQLSKLCGWMQINNTVTPYINRASGKFVPLSVIVYAAGLLRKDHVGGLLPTPEECNLLNATCQTAGFDFSFGKNTRLIHIAEVVQKCQVRIFELPFENPLQHAQYIDSLQQGDSTGGGGGLAPPPAPNQSSITGSMSLPYRSKPLGTGPPNVNIFGGQYDPFISMMNMLSQPSTSTTTMTRDTQQMSMRFPPQASQASQMPMQNVPRFFPPSPHLPGMPVNPGMNSFNQSVLNLAGLRPEMRAVSSHGHKAPPNSLASGAQSQAERPRQADMVPRGHMPPPPPYGHMPSYHMQRPGQPPLPAASSAPHMFPSHKAGMIYSGFGPLPRGAVPMIGFPPPPGVPPGHQGMPGLTGVMPPPQAPMPPQQLSSAPTRSSPRSSGMSPVGERVSPARQSPVIPHANLVQGRDAAGHVHMNSLSQGRESSITGPVNSLHHPREPAVPVHIATAGQNVEAVVPVPQAVHMNTANHNRDRAVPVHMNTVSHIRDAVVPVELNPACQDAATRLADPHKTASPQSRPKTTATSDGHLKLVADITAVLVHNKSISCLVRNSPERRGKFCLVEAVSKLYFPHCKLGEFVHALQNVLKLDLPLCSEEEAKAFIHFYNLPVTILNDNHMIRLEDLQTYFPQMAYMFGPCDGAKTSKPQPVTVRRSSGSESTRVMSPSAPITVVLTSNDTDEVISIDSDPPTPVLGSPGVGPGTGLKRVAPQGVTGPPSKQPCHRLEKMVQRLKQTQETPGDPSGQNTDGGSTPNGTAGASTTINTQPPTNTAPVIVID